MTWDWRGWLATMVVKYAPIVAQHIARKLRNNRNAALRQAALQIVRERDAVAEAEELSQ